MNDPEELKENKKTNRRWSSAASMAMTVDDVEDDYKCADGDNDDEAWFGGDGDGIIVLKQTNVIGSVSKTFENHQKWESLKFDLKAIRKQVKRGSRPWWDFSNQVSMASAANAVSTASAIIIISAVTSQALGQCNQGNI